MPQVVTFTPNPAIDVSTSVDAVVPTRKLRCAPARRDPGGGGINVARVIARLGGDVTALYPMGGSAGRLLHRLLEQEGVRSETVLVSDETRKDFTVLEQTSGLQFRFVLPGPKLGAGEWQNCLDALAAIDAGARLIVASGSLPLGVPEDFYARAARHAAKLGIRFVLDAAGAPLSAALREPIHLLKPNLNELQSLAGTALESEAQWLKAARRLVADFPIDIVALTLGHRGALLVTRDEAVRAAPLGVNVASAVGAGDSFLGGMVFKLARGDALREAFRYGVAAGSAAVLNPGTALCVAADVDELYRKVVIEAI